MSKVTLKRKYGGWTLNFNDKAKAQEFFAKRKQILKTLFKGCEIEEKDDYLHIIQGNDSLTFSIC